MQPIIVGGGLAGLLTALHLAPMPVTLLVAAPLGEQASSTLAQGGIAAAIGADDSIASHIADTLASGDGLCAPAAVARIIAEAPETIEELCRRGVRFDRTDAGFALGLEAAHASRRILHAEGDGSGREIMRALIAAVRATSSITIIENARVRRLLLRDGAVQGVLAETSTGPLLRATNRVLLATGGAGALHAHTTNPRFSNGSGLALAARAGAVLADLEFIQFHPTALDSRADPMPLISEAVRGEGAWIIDETNTRFTAGQELAPRDVVARAVAAHINAGHRVFLDARPALGDRFAARFPAITASCHAHGIDPTREPIPIRPAAHYHMGGIAVDSDGRSSVPGLWACGEVASTGLHGANRLASNSLLEAAVCARAAARSIAGVAPAAPRPFLAPLLPPPVDATSVRPIVSAALGVIRDGATLHRAIARLLPLVQRNGPNADPALVALLMSIAALRRQESRGSHVRRDHPTAAPQWARSQPITLDDALAEAHALAAVPQSPRVQGA